MRYTARIYIPVITLKWLNLTGTNTILYISVFINHSTKEAINTLPFLHSMNLTLFILLNSAPDFSLQSGLINERITFSHWHKPIVVISIKKRYIYTVKSGFVK